MEIAKQVVPYSRLDEYVETLNEVFLNGDYYGWEMVNSHEADMLSRSGRNYRVRVVGAPEN